MFINKNIIYPLFLVLFIGGCFGNLNYIQDTYGEHNFRLLQVVLEKNGSKTNKEIVVSSSQDGDSLKDLVDKKNGIAGVNGAFFQPKDYGNSNNLTNADRVVDGRLDYSANGDFGARGMFGFTKNGEPLLVADNYGYVPGGIGKYNVDKKGDIYNGISNHPILLVQGENRLQESKSGLSLFDRVESKGTKNFICSTKSGTKVYMGSIFDIKLDSLPDYLVNSFDCYHSILLDSGGSRSMIYDNEYIQKESRPIMDAFVVVNKEKRKKYQNKVDKGVSIVNNTISKYVEANYQSGKPKAFDKYIQDIKQALIDYHNSKENQLLYDIAKSL